jgi:hypothetical protein
MEEVKEVGGREKVGELDLYLQAQIIPGQSIIGQVSAIWSAFGSLEQQAVCCRFCRGRSSIWGGGRMRGLVTPCQPLKAARGACMGTQPFPPPRPKTPHLHHLQQNSRR